MSNQLGMSQAEIKARLMGLNRKERRAFPRRWWHQMEPWNDPEYDHLSRQEARSASWETVWSQLKADCIKESLNREVAYDAAVKAQESVLPTPLIPFIRCLVNIWRVTLGRIFK